VNQSSLSKSSQIIHFILNYNQLGKVINILNDAVLSNQWDIVVVKLNQQKDYIEKRRSVRIRRSKLLQATENIEYKIASSTEELEEAFELVTQQYLSTGLHTKEHELRVTKFHLLPDSKVFIAIKKTAGEKDRVIGTLTMILDSAMGLPMDEIYHQQLNRMRVSGLEMAEVICLAVSPAQSNLQNNIVMYLYKICLQFLRYTEVNEILCTVKQKHSPFYEDLLLFKPIGELVAYSYANGMIIQGYKLNINLAIKEFKQVYSGMEFDADLHRFFFTETRKFNRPYGKGDAMTIEQLRYFIEKRTKLISSLSNKDMNILRDEFSAQDKVFAY